MTKILIDKAALAQEPVVAAYWAVVDWNGKYIQVDQNTMQLEVYETEKRAKANVQPRTKATLVYISATPPAPAQPVAWQFYQGGKWHNGMETNDHRKHTEAAGLPVRDLYPGVPITPPAPAQEPVAYMVETDQGVMFWPAEDYDEASTYCDDEQWPVKLYTTPPAPAQEPAATDRAGVQ